MIGSGRRARAIGAATLGVALAALPAAPALADSIRSQEWHLANLDIAAAHRITEGADVTVAVIDSGVNAGQQDLAGAVETGIDLNPGESGDGRRDLEGHGTEMAGIIAARGHGDNDGVLGIAPEAKILPISVPTGLTTSTSVAKAVDFAIDHHAGVINMSFGTGDDPTLHDAVGKALAADIVVVTAAGNDDKDNADYPGKYPEVLTVGASGRDGKLASFSTTGPQVDIVAPGVDIVTTGNRGADDYYKGDGTSEATAVVSGAAALLRAKFPDLSAAEIVHRLTATATDAGPKGRDDSYGYGRLNVVKALTADVAPLPTPGASSAVAGGATVGPTAAADSSDLPAAKSPLLLVGIVVGLLVIVGLVVVLVLAGRRRRAG